MGGPCYPGGSYIVDGELWPDLKKKLLSEFLNDFSEFKSC